MSDRAAVWDAYFLFRFTGEDPPASVDLPIDYWDFNDEAKLGPALLYRRRLPTGTDPVTYFSGNESGVLISQNRVVLDPLAVAPMGDDMFWSLAKTTSGQPWAYRINEIVRSLRTQSVAGILAFHRTLESKLSSLEHPLRSVLIGNGEIEPDATGAAIAAVVLDGPAAYSYEAAHVERLEDVEGLTRGDVLSISRRALKEGHGIDADVATGSGSRASMRAEPTETEVSLTADDVEHEAAYRELLYGFRDPVWDSSDVAEWLSARAMVQIDGGAEELIFLAARLAGEERSHTIGRILDRVIAEGPLLAGPEVATPLFARPGFRSTPFFEIVSPKTVELGAYLRASGYPMLQSASLAVDEIHPRWAVFSPE